MSVVEIAIVRTIANVLSAPLLKNTIELMQKIDDTIPDMTLTRTGVPNRLLKTPNQGKNAPSYAATAWIRSEPIIQTAPEVTSVPMKQIVMKISNPCAAPPYTLNTVVTASMNPPMPVIAFAGSTRMIPKIGMTYSSTPMIPLRRTEIGTSRWGSSISSAAAFWSSKPT